MKRFNFERYGDDDFDDDNPEDFGEDSKDHPDQIVDSQLIALQIEQNFLLEQEINEKILVDSINLCKSSVFWRFKSMKNKLQIIKETYDGLRKIHED